MLPLFGCSATCGRCAFIYTQASAVLRLAAFLRCFSINASALWLLRNLRSLRIYIYASLRCATACCVFEMLQHKCFRSLAAPQPAVAAHLYIRKPPLCYGLLRF